MASSESVSLTWLGQAGYAVRAGEQVCVIDAYLSDSIPGTSRIAAIPLDPAELTASVVVATHWHDDHLDRATCEALARANPNALFVGPPKNAELLHTWDIPTANIYGLSLGASLELGSFVLRACFARHEIPWPEFQADDAISLVIEAGGVRIFHSGDTEYDARMLEALQHGPVDVGLYAINGTGGNMNAYEAALLAWQMRPRVAVPMHYGMWSAEGYGGSELRAPTLDPQTFCETYASLGGGDTLVLELGAAIELSM